MQLSEEKRIEINNLLPNAVNIKSKLLTVPPSIVAIKSGPNRNLDLALICLLDASDVACDVVYALGMSLSYLAWYREEAPNAPLEMDAAIRGRYYIDDAAIRLYTASEHVANFIINFVEISSSELDSFRKKNRISDSVTVGKYMVEKYPDHRITHSINQLMINNDWVGTLQYRNDWVHKQPPPIKDTGIVYERKSRWTKEGNTYIVGFGGGDPPKHSVDSLSQMILSGAHSFINLLAELSELLIVEIEKLGIEIDFKNQNVKSPF